MRRLVLPASLALGLALSGVLPAHARGDADPPVLAEFDYSPKSVDVSTSAKLITVTARITDATAVNTPVVTITSDTADQSQGPTAMTFSGTATNSSWTVDFTIPTSATPGPWTVTIGNLVDVWGNARPDQDHPTKLTVTNPGADTDPPELRSFTFSPQTIDVSTGAKTVTIDARVTDASGVTQMAAQIDKDGGSATTGILPMTRVSGKPKDGVWRATVSIPLGAPPGPWTVSLYPIFDTAGNSDNLTPEHPSKLIVHHPGMKKCLGQVVTVNLRFGQTPTNGNDVILGTQRPETIDALGGNDVVCGARAKDVIRGGPGNDTLDGGRGTDTVSYLRAARPVTVSLASTGPQNTGRSSGRDTLSGFERAWGGNAGDHLTGTNGTNQLLGGTGRDVLLGLGGPDRLLGGAGRDRCDGGPAIDTAEGCEVRRRIP